MSTPADVVMEDDESSKGHQSFTLEENIQQLNAIDKDVVQLMRHTSTAFNSLTTPAFDKGSSAQNDQEGSKVDSQAQKEAFRSATESFLSTLHSVDVRFKRQIMALEEAGIINLSAAPTRQAPGSSTKPKVSLKPNGVGAVGNLDVGWLNSRSTRVERDMEAELWRQAKELLQNESGQKETD